MATAFLGIGSNLGDRMATISTALTMLSETEDIKQILLSSLYETKPIGFADQPDFINCVARVSIELKPRALLTIIKSIERKMGRAPDSHLMPRPIDIDILLYNNMVYNSPDLSIPHPRLKDRRFVLEPLVEIEPGAIDPVSSLPLTGFLDRVSNQGLKKIADSKEVANVRRLFS